MSKVLIFYFCLLLYFYLNLVIHNIKMPVTRSNSPKPGFPKVILFQVPCYLFLLYHSDLTQHNADLTLFLTLNFIVGVCQLIPEMVTQKPLSNNHCLNCCLFSGNASTESNGPDLALQVSHQSECKLHVWQKELFKQTYSHEDSIAEGSLIFRPAADERLLLSKHIHLIFSCEHASPVTQAKCLHVAFYFRAQKLQFRD